MSTKLISRIVAVVLMGTGLGIWLHFREEAHHQMGREAFVAEQGAFWDRAYSHAHALAFGVVFSVILAILLWSAYECLAAGIHRVIRGLERKDPADCSRP